MNDACALTLTIDPMPTASAGPDDAFCVLNPINVTGAVATNFSSYQWFAGDGTFNNNTRSHPPICLGNLDFNAGSVTLTFAVQGRLSCSAQTVTDTRVFAVSPFPVVNAEGPIIISAAIPPSLPLPGLGIIMMQPISNGLLWEEMVF